MKTSTSYKLQRLNQAIRAGEKPEVVIRGTAEIHKVARLRNRQHSIELTLDRNAGFLIVDPDDVLSVKVRSQPTRDDD